MSRLRRKDLRSLRSSVTNLTEGSGDLLRIPGMTTDADNLTPRPEHRFTFGLWTVGNPGRDPFGDPTRAPVDPVDSVHRLSELGAWGVSLHDNDLVPWGSSAEEEERIVARFEAALKETGMGVGMATTNLFG